MRREGEVELRPERLSGALAPSDLTQNRLFDFGHVSVVLLATLVVPTSLRLLFIAVGLEDTRLGRVLTFEMFDFY